MISTLASQFSILCAQGDDASTFLHAQFSNDINGLVPEKAILAAYCTPKGRMLASVIVWKDNSKIYLLLSRDISQSVLKRLSMFILRSKVKLSLLDDNHFNLVGITTHLSLAQARLQGIKTETWGLSQRSIAQRWISLPRLHTEQARWLSIHMKTSPDDNLKLSDLELPEGFSYIESSMQWSALDIAAGLPWINSANQDLFIPQTINFDRLGGISYTKGCYPGQEVIARTHYLGKQKRHAYYGHTEISNISLNQPMQTELKANLDGSDIWHESLPNEPVGRIINSVNLTATIPPDNAQPSVIKYALLFETQDYLMEEDLKHRFHLKHIDGPLITIHGLPSNPIEE